VELRARLAPAAPEEHRRPLALVDWRAIELDPNTREGRLARPGMKLGLGAIAKGYGVDRASLVLVQHGFKPTTSSRVAATPTSPAPRAAPRGRSASSAPTAPAPLAAIPASDRAIVTSGGYQRFLEHDGKRYAHILDPSTGWPIDEEPQRPERHGPRRHATDADAYATAVAVMGPEKGMAFVEAHPELEAVIVTRSGEILVSQDLRAHPVCRRSPDKAPGA
jgi:thiamine biosynthesis lipoprotein